MLVVAAYVIFCVLAPIAIQTYREARKRAEVQQKMDQIREALEKYKRTHPQPDKPPSDGPTTD